MRSTFGPQSNKKHSLCLKKKLVSTSILTYSDFFKEFYFFTNTSEIAIGSKPRRGE
ncbi:9789_t:CDS:1, partial [Gigaspora rosea]